MAAAKLNLTVEQGSTFVKRLIWRDSKKRPINLAGYTAKMQIRAAASALSPIIFELSTANGRITMPGGGVIELGISVDDTFDMKGGVYDLVLYAPGPSGGQYRLVEGKVVVSPAVTQG